MNARAEEASRHDATIADQFTRQAAQFAASAMRGALGAGGNLSCVASIPSKPCGGRAGSCAAGFGRPGLQCPRLVTARYWTGVVSKIARSLHKLITVFRLSSWLGGCGPALRARS